MPHRLPVDLLSHLHPGWSQAVDGVARGGNVHLLSPWAARLWSGNSQHRSRAAQTNGLFAVFFPGVCTNCRGPHRDGDKEEPS